MRFAAAILFILVYPAVAQVNSDIAGKYAAYRSSLPRYVTDVRFSQQKYAPGDTAWFRTWFLNEDMSVIPGRQVLDFNLVDAKGISRLHFRFHVTDGLSHNQFALPANLDAGYYYAVVSNTWMKNFGKPQVGRYLLQVVTDKRIGPAETLLEAAPEGGHLVAGVKNNLIIRSNRGGIQVSLTDDQNQIVATTALDRDGTGTITFIPRELKYKLAIAGDTTQLMLPDVIMAGVAVMLGPDVDGSRTLTLRSSNRPYPADLNAVVVLRGNVVATLPVKAGWSDSLRINIPCHNLASGVAQLSLIDAAGRVYATRDFYVQRKADATLLPLGKTADIRGGVRATLQLADKNGPVTGSGVIRVLNARSRSDDDHLTTPDARYNDRLLIIGSTAEAWPDILASRKPSPKFPLTTSLYQEGQVYFTDKPDPVPNLVQLAFYFQETNATYQTFTLNKGWINLSTPDFYGTDELFYVAAFKGAPVKNIDIRWNENRIDLPAAPRARELDADDEYATFALRRKMIGESFGYYTGTPSGNETSLPEVSDFEDEIMGVDVTIRPADYVTFTSMLDMQREILPQVFVQKKKRDTLVRLELIPPLVSDGEPVYIIDGRATTNTSFFLSLKPADIVSLKLALSEHRLKLLGLLGRNGVVIVQTKQGNLRDPAAPALHQITGLSKPLAFNDKREMKMDAHFPDFRSLVYWNPMMKTGGDGTAMFEFRCGDDVGELLLIAEGYTSAGDPFYAETTITVKQ